MFRTLNNSKNDFSSVERSIKFSHIWKKKTSSGWPQWETCSLPTPRLVRSHLPGWARDSSGFRCRLRTASDRALLAATQECLNSLSVPSISPLPECNCLAIGPSSGFQKLDLQRKFWLYLETIYESFGKRSLHAKIFGAQWHTSRKIWQKMNNFMTNDSRVEHGRF